MGEEGQKQVPATYVAGVTSAVGVVRQQLSPITNGESDEPVFTSYAGKSTVQAAVVVIIVEGEGEVVCEVTSEWGGGHGCANENEKDDMMVEKEYIM